MLNALYLHTEYGNTLKKIKKYLGNHNIEYKEEGEY